MGWITALISAILALITKICKRNDEQVPQDDTNAEETTGIMAGVWESATDIGGDVSEFFTDEDGDTNLPLLYGTSLGIAAMIDPEDASETSDKVAESVAIASEGVSDATLAPVKGVGSSLSKNSWIIGILLIAGLLWLLFGGDEVES